MKTKYLTTMTLAAVLNKQRSNLLFEVHLILAVRGLTHQNQSCRDHAERKPLH